MKKVIFIFFVFVCATTFNKIYPQPFNLTVTPTVITQNSYRADSITYSDGGTYDVGRNGASYPFYTYRSYGIINSITLGLPVDAVIDNATLSLTFYDYKPNYTLKIVTLSSDPTFNSAATNWSSIGSGSTWVSQVTTANTQTPSISNLVSKLQAIVNGSGPIYMGFLSNQESTNGTNVQFYVTVQGNYHRQGSIFYVKNSFDAGTISVDNNNVSSGTQFTWLDATTHPLGAIDQPYAGYNRVWNTTGVSGTISNWQKKLSGVTTNLSPSRNYTFTAHKYDAGASIVADLKPVCNIYLSKETEFDGASNYDLVGSAVQQNPISVQAPSSLTISSNNYYFAGWKDGVQQNPRSVTPIIHTYLAAIYKVIHKSNDATAFSNNSQRRLIETNSGNNPRWLHQVYTSSINGVSHVWIEHSSNGGSSWIIGNNEKPLDGGAGGKNPSIAFTSNSNYNFIGVVWQQPSGSHYAICGKMFNQNIGTSDVPHPVDDASYTIFTEPSDAYTINANPNLVLTAQAYGPFFITYERKSTSGSLQPGINWVVGYISEHLSIAGWDGSFGSVNSSGIISGTNASSINVQMSPYPDYNTSIDISVNLLRQQGSPGTIYSHYLHLTKVNGYWQYYQYDDGMISYNSPVNFAPSIVSLADYVYASCWIEYSDMTFYFYDNHIRYYFGSNGSGAQSCSINRGGGSSNSGFAAWSLGGTNKSIRFDNGVPVTSSIQNLSTSGKYVQVGNSASSNLSYMYVSSFYPFYLPYYFNTSGTLTPLSKGNPELVTGRGFDINIGDAAFSYRFGDLNMDGKNISFVEAPDELDYGKIETLNNVLVTEPFQVNANSKIIFSEMSGFADTLAAAKKLGKDGFINFKLELIDETTGKVIAPIKNENLNSSNAHSVRTPAYSLNANGLAGKIVRIKISLESNLVTEYKGQLAAGDSSNIPDAVKARLNVIHSNLILTKSFSEENSTLGKTSLTELAIDNLNIPTVYALDQNYPNPFNPTTVINYQIPKDGLVTLKIYDVLGREVKTLVNEQKTIGRYEVKFNASDLASGVYIYQINVNDFTSSMKMLLMK